MIFKKKKTIPLSDHNRITKQLQEELIRKDNIIKNLKEESNIVIKTMFKANEKNSEIKKQADKLLDINKKLTTKINNN